MTDKTLHKRLLDVCYKKQLHHLGSYFSSLDLIDDIYSKMNLDEDIFILSAGHSVVALYVVLESILGMMLNGYMRSLEIILKDMRN